MTKKQLAVLSDRAIIAVIRKCESELEQRARMYRDFMERRKRRRVPGAEVWRKRSEGQKRRWRRAQAHPLYASLSGDEKKGL